MTKERPILFSGPMVRAIREGRKTMTRRIVNPQPPEWCERFGYTCFTPKGSISGRGIYKDHGPAEKFFKLKHGAPGDRLWVRETWCSAFDHEHWGTIFAADGAFVRHDHDRMHEKGPHYNANDRPPMKYRPSIFMPRWASRITLEITNVHVERLQRISASDAISEGIEANCEDGVTYYGPYGNGHCDPREAFRFLWDSINAKRSPWSSNPWVWVIEFKDVSSNG